MNSILAVTEHRFVKTPVLSSDRLILKEINRHDVGSMVDISVYNGVFATNITEAINILDQINGDVENGESLHWGIFLKDSSELVDIIAGTPRTTVKLAIYYALCIMVGAL